MAIETTKFRKFQTKKKSRKTTKLGVYKLLIVLFVIIPIIFLFTNPKDRASFFSYYTAKVYERIGNLTMAKKYYAAAYDNSGKEDFRSWIKTAEMCNRLGQYYDARTMTENMVDFGISDELELSEVYRLNGEANGGLENYDDALEAFLISVRYNGDNYYALIGAGKMHRMKGDYNKSKDYLEDAIEKRQLRAPEAHYELGLTYMAENNNADALDEFDLVLRQMPSRKLRQLATEQKINIISNTR